MFFCFCNLTIVAGEVGVPGSEGKVNWLGTESKWTYFSFGKLEGKLKRQMSMKGQRTLQTLEDFRT